MFSGFLTALALCMFIFGSLGESIKDESFKAQDRARSKGKYPYYFGTRGKMYSFKTNRQVIIGDIYKEHPTSPKNYIRGKGLIDVKSGKITDVYYWTNDTTMLGGRGPYSAAEYVDGEKVYQI